MVKKKGKIEQYKHANMENEKIRGANNLDNSKGDRHKMRAWYNVLSGQIANGHKSKIIYMLVLAESSLSGEQLGMLET